MSSRKPKLFAIEIQEEAYYESDIVQECCRTTHSLSCKTFAAGETPPSNSIPVGSVTWCEKIYGSREPCYYPDFMAPYMYRRPYVDVFDPDKSYHHLFVKPASRYKSFNGTTDFKNGVCTAGTRIWCSEIVRFRHEWRYYVANGRVFAAAWYDGESSDEEVLSGLTPPPPDLSKEILPLCSKWCGLLDMGEIVTATGVVLGLVEASHPYGFGWYPEENNAAFIDFLIASDDYLRS